VQQSDQFNIMPGMDWAGPCTTFDVVPERGKFKQLDPTGSNFVGDPSTTLPY